MQTIIYLLFQVATLVQSPTSTYTTKVDAKTQTVQVQVNSWENEND